MLITPTLTIAGVDYSKLFNSSHSEQTTNDSKDENKYDVTLVNGAGQLFGLFKPKDPISLSVVVRHMKCVGSTAGSFNLPIHIFTGEVQKVTCDELECKIEGSCKQGGMVSSLPKTFTWPPGTKVGKCVNDLLDAFGFTGKRHIIIETAKDTPTKHTPDASGNVDFNTTIQLFADEVGCNWFFDEGNEFWFVPPVELKGTKDLTHHVMAGQTGRTMIGLCTVVNVIGSSQYDPASHASVNMTHASVAATARADDPGIIERMAGENMIATYGHIIAPPIIVPNCDQATCQRIADSTLLWFLQFKDVPEVKVTGIAPVVFSRVSYSPFNGNPIKLSCNAAAITPISMGGSVVGLVTKRIVDISPDVGLECALSVSTNMLGNLKSSYTLYEDPDIVNPYEGVYAINV